MRGVVALRIVFLASAAGVATGAWLVGSALADGNIWKGVAGGAVFALAGTWAMSLGLLLRAI